MLNVGPERIDGIADWKQGDSGLNVSWKAEKGQILRGLESSFIFILRTMGE